MSPLAGRTAVRLRRWHPGPSAWIAATAVFTVSTVLQVVGVPGTSSFGTRTRFDLDVYRLGGQLWHQGISLYADGSMPFTQDGIWLPFTYPPFAALVFTPLGAIPLDVAGIAISAISALCLLYVTVVFLRMLSVGNRLSRVIGALWITAAAVWFNPFGMTFGYGQINLILLALIVADLFVLGRREPPNVLRGSLIGLASAIKLTPLVFLGVFAVANRWRAFWTGVGTFVVAALIGLAWLPADSLRYWTHTLFHTGRIGVPEGPINQNLNGAWLRLLGPDNPAAPSAWVMSALAVTVLAVLALVATRPVSAFGASPTRRDDVNALLAACIVGFWGLMVAPTTWAHHWVWALPAILACFVIAGATTDRATARRYGALAVIGLPVFGIGPFQLMPADVTAWSWWQQIVGNAYLLWGIAFLILLWRRPFRHRPADDPSLPTGRTLP